MMFWRNPEIIRTSRIWVVLILLFTGIAFFISPVSALYVWICSGLLFGLHLGITRKRYARLSAFSLEIDRLLHGCETMDLARFEEGELAILQNEIYKMTLRLREQREILKRDKVYLADSLADISHQIRTPLTSVHLIAGFLLEDDLPQARRLQLARELQKHLAATDWMLTTLLKLSRLDTGTVQMETQPVPAETLIKQALQGVEIPMELRGQTFELKKNASFFLQVDPVWMGEAITNILKNCMEHTPDGGSICVRLSENALYQEICMTDTGLGIAPEDLPHIFERFYKGKNRSTDSFGIGLALSKKIVQAHGGSLQAENQPEGGARFVLRFYKTTV